MSRWKLFRVVKISCFFVTSLLLSRLVERPVVLCFHRIRKSSGSLLDQRIGVTDPDSFRKVINYLRILGYSFVSLENLNNSINTSKLKRVAVITFDDGYKDMYQNAFPILKSLNIPFSLFLTTSTVESEKLLWLHKLYIAIDRLSLAKRFDILKKYEFWGKTDDDLFNIMSRIIDSNVINIMEKKSLASEIAYAAGLDEDEERLLAEELYLTKTELREMQKHGLSIEVHGHEHLPLGNLNKAETEEEIKNSVLHSRKELNVVPKYYSIPFGINNKYFDDIVKNVELNGIVTGEQRLVKEFENIYRLPRICMQPDNMHFYRRMARSYGKVFLEKMHLVKSDHH
ncbi:MAG: polysaccharide deacetylase family protein [Smithella sp.]